MAGMGKILCASSKFTKRLISRLMTIIKCDTTTSNDAILNGCGDNLEQSKQTIAEVSPSLSWNLVS